MISQATIEEIKSRMDIYEVVSEFVQLKKSGSTFRGLSPFTSEKTPSFYVHPSRQFFKDFSSQKGGDAITFLQELEGMSYTEALRWLAQRYGIAIEEEGQNPEQEEAQKEKESLLVVMEMACAFFEDQLWNTAEGKTAALAYLRERAISDEAIRKFRLGYSPDRWDGLLKHAEEKGFKPEMLEKAGLLRSKDDRHYDYFRGRAMFPITSVANKVIAFGARKLKEDDPMKGKYVNSPETPLYHKSRVLYGLGWGRQAIRREDNCYIVEGYTDVIAMHMAGVEHAVSSSGTALTEEQIRLLSRYTPKVTALFDGDRAGMSASFRGIDMLLKEGLDVQAVAFPEGHDPDSYARELGGQGFKDFLVAKAQDFVAFKAGTLAEEAAADPAKKVEAIRSIVDSISLLDSSIKRDVYIREASKIMDVSQESLVAEVNKLRLLHTRQELQQRQKDELREEVKQAAEAPVQGSARLSEAERVELQEREAMRLLLSYGHDLADDQYRFAYYMLAELEEVPFQTPIYREMVQEYKEHLDKGKVPNEIYFLHHSRPEVRDAVALMLDVPYEESEAWLKTYGIRIPKEADRKREVLYQNVTRLKLRVLEQQLLESRQRLAQAATVEEEQAHLTAYRDLRQVAAKLAQELDIVVSQ